MSVSDDYPRPSVTTDAVVFKAEPDRLTLLLIRRKHAPFEGMWALPGGFLNEDEDLDACARRELAEETGLTGVALYPLANFSTPRRDPRGWTVSAAYVGLAGGDATAVAADDAAEAAWHGLKDLPPLAFDHAQIVAKAVAWLSVGGPKNGIKVTDLL